MFKFKNSNSGKIRVKLLATLLVLTLTFANFSLIGSYIGESIAVDVSLSNQESIIQGTNVNFDVYLAEGDSSVKEIETSITSQETKVYVSLSVQGEGELKNPVLELVDTNFKFKNSPETTRLELDSIQEENGISVGIPVVAKDDELYNLSLLDMESQIKLTGEYEDALGNVTDIDKIKTVRITWTSDELTEEDMVLSKEVITNKIYPINGVDKRIVQILVKSQVKDNKAPVRRKNIEITNPEIGAVPEQVKVASYGTKATNGKTHLEFADNTNSSCEYNSETGTTIISLINIKNEQNLVAWNKNCEDIFVITYIYDENTVVNPFTSTVKSLTNCYGTEVTEIIEKTDNLPLEEIAETGDIVTIESSITENIYKGKMYIGEDTNYQTESKIYVPYSEIVNEILIRESEEELIDEVSTYYKETKINVRDAQKVLGTDATIMVYNAEDNTTPIKTISLTNQIEEEYYTISYPDSVSGILIKMLPAQSENEEEQSTINTGGIIEIINEKVIKVTDTNGVADITELKLNTPLGVTGINGETIVFNTNNKSTAKLLEPQTTFDIALDKIELSTQVENELTITAELIAKDESNKLFKGTTENPVTINIELPAQIKEASIENITPIVGNDELTLKSSDIEENKIVLEILGEQTEYSELSSTITIDLKVKTEEFLADENVEIKATCINDGQTAQNSEHIKLVSETGLITASKMNIGTNNVEVINKNDISANITENANSNIFFGMINNYKESISNINIIGKIPQGIVLKEHIVISGIEEVFYSEEENADINSDTWVLQDKVNDYSKIKSFKITLSELKNGDILSLITSMHADIEDVDNGVALIRSLNISYEINEQPKEEQFTYTLNVVKEETDSEGTDTPGTDTPTTPENPEAKAEITITPKTTTNTLHEGQIVTYELKVKNTGSETLNNVTLDYIVPEGAVLTELTFAQGTRIEFTDDTETKNKIYTIESIQPNQTITKEITLKILDGASNITNKATLKDEQANIIAEYVSESVTVNEGELTVRLSRRDNLSVELSEGSQIIYVVIVTNNTSTEMKNLLITSKVPEQTDWLEDSQYNTKWNYNNNTKNLGYTIDSLKPGETKEVRFEVEINNSINDEISNNVVVTTSDKKQYESNIFTSHVLMPKWDITMTTPNSEKLSEGENIKYIIKVTNSGKRKSAVSIQDDLPEQIDFTKALYYIDENDKVELTDFNKDFHILHPVDVGQTLTIELEGTVGYLDDNVPEKTITNFAKIDLGNGEYLESNKITSVIVNGNSNNNKEAIYSIEGIVWIDENKDGTRGKQEKTVQALKVMLLDKDGKQVDATKTSLTGTYKFTNLPQGEYVVAFEYDTSKYAVTKYQMKNVADELNSDVISKEITLNNENKKVAVTDKLKVEDDNITNIDMGLVENPEFDLSLSKYISKVVVSNSKGSTTYEYDNTQLAKVEIAAKELAGSTILVEYNIEISNDGDVNGYVTDIIDYLPKELEFNSEMNTEWYIGTDKNLHYMAIEPQAIEPGKTQTVKLVLTKTLKSNSTGTIENIAEIAESTNLESLVEKDSIVNNKQEGEDDLSKASLIVSVKTGSPIMYIGIVIASMLVLGMGIYIINKKILRVKI